MRSKPAIIAIGVAANRGKDRRHQVPAHLARHVDHHPEVEQHHLAIGGEEQVPRMRIGVKEPVDEHHLEIELHDGPHHAARVVRLFAGTCLHAIDAHPFHVLEPQHAPRDQGVDHARDRDLAVSLEVVAYAPRVRRLEDEVHLLAHLGRVLLDHRARVAHVRVRVAPRQPTRERDGDAQVLGDELLHAGAKDLDHDLLALVARPVHLA
jgi:hypothetical protein